MQTAVGATVLAVLVVIGAAVAGIAGITVGWVPPFTWKRVLRPRLWGYGTLIGAVGMGGFLFFGPLTSMFALLDGRPADHFVFAVMGMAVFFLGSFMQALSWRPARTP
ncbi:hypothetical protein ACFYNZ_07815 [Streptomyces kebangsaanensis]|uniref:Uncharacterized protein n=1 Tax=Streptomyces kebangsaanensis TaxID=864058 RepID=A0ABW6KSH5_9ACTN